MPISFKSANNGLQFAQLGLTSSLSGITLTTTLVDTGSGATLPTSIVPTALNYVIGSGLTGQTRGASFQTVTNGILSLTTQSSRVVEIQLKSISATASSYWEYRGVDNFLNSGNMRILRGPSTVIDGGLTQFDFDSTGASVLPFLYRLPACTWQFVDFTPISGAATYVLQAQTDGASTHISFLNVALYVRQL